jgi:hypothetical protein
MCRENFRNGMSAMMREHQGREVSGQGQIGGEGENMIEDKREDKRADANAAIERASSRIAWLNSAVHPYSHREQEDVRAVLRDMVDELADTDD